MTIQQEILCRFILAHNLELSNDSEELQKLMANMPASQVAECIGKACQDYDDIRKSGLGRELL
jgi:hypothetical protein